MAKKASKEIVVLSERDHIRNRPQMYVGSVKPTEEKIPVIKNSKIIIEEKSVSIGMYKILNEAIDNAIDEAKRMGGKMKSVIVKVNPKTNTISVKDSGNGFYNGTSINESTGKTNIETAFSQLRSGSNFSNDDIEESLIGTNGYGIKTLNVLSERFKVITINDTHYFEKEWIDFESDDSKTIIRKKKSGEQKGTYIEAEPLKEVFGDSKWDLDILQASLVFKQRLILKDPILKTLKIHFFWDEEEISLTNDFLPKESFSLETPIGEVIIWEKYEGSGSVSFINSAMCTGIHQKMINEYINEKLEDNLGHHFYDTFLSLNLPPKIVKFGDQNKTRFVSPREEVHPYIDMEIGKRIASFFRTPIFMSIKQKVDERRNEGEYKKLKAQRKKINVKFSHKYFPASTKSPENLFIVEGLSASGSILQKRQPHKDAVYALKGKIKNARSLGDLSTNKEILELMQILNLDPENSKLECPFQKIVIATDADYDGYHIRSLIINLFTAWFPWIVEQGKIYIMETPIITIGDRTKKYFYSVDEFLNFKGQKSSVRYLKGLGSLSIQDWDYVMADKLLIQIKKDAKGTKNLEMAFGKFSSLRKDWLSSK